MSSRKIILTCNFCGSQFEKEKKEHTRQLKKDPNRQFYCDLSCSMKWKRENDPQTFIIDNSDVLINFRDGSHNIKYNPLNTYYIARARSRNTKTNNEVMITSNERIDFENHIEKLWTGTCYYTGVSIHRRLKSGKCPETKNPFFIASLDRIDNSKGYEIGNVIWTSYALNLARNDCDYSKYQNDLRKFMDTLASQIMNR